MKIFEHENFTNYSILVLEALNSVFEPITDVYMNVCMYVCMYVHLIIILHFNRTSG